MRPNNVAKNFDCEASPLTNTHFKIKANTLRDEISEALPRALIPGMRQPGEPTREEYDLEFECHISIEAQSK
jgi:hypothetical protein